MNNSEDDAWEGDCEWVGEEQCQERMDDRGLDVRAEERKHFGELSHR